MRRKTEMLQRGQVFAEVLTSHPHLFIYFLPCLLFFVFSLPPAGGSSGRFPVPKQRRYSTNRGRTGLSSSERARVRQEISLSQSSEYRCGKAAARRMETVIHAHTVYL